MVGHAVGRGAGVAPPSPDSGGLSTMGISARWTLDSVFEAAKAIAQDYRSRYRRYRAAPPAIAGILASMNSGTGCDPASPNKTTDDKQFSGDRANSMGEISRVLQSPDGLMTQ